MKSLFKNPARYQAYLASEKWGIIRRRVLDRDKGLCQGCLQDKATEVHHRTYQNLFDEFAFELISLCSACHERLHRQRGTPNVARGQRIEQLMKMLEDSVKARNAANDDGSKDDAA